MSDGRGRGEGWVRPGHGPRPPDCRSGVGLAGLALGVMWTLCAEGSAGTSRAQHYIVPRQPPALPLHSLASFIPRPAGPRTIAAATADTAPGAPRPPAPAAMTAAARAIAARLLELRRPDVAAHSQRFFKTGPGEYGEGDQFLGIRMPELRKEVAAAYEGCSIATAEELLHSPYHEVRMFALIMWVRRFEKV